MYNKRIIRFAFCDILNNQGLSKCYQPPPSAQLITLTSTLIIPAITKTSSNDCLLYAYLNFASQSFSSLFYVMIQFHISSLRIECLSCTRHSFCHTFIIVLQYGIFVACNSEKLEALNKRILRFILNDFTSHDMPCLTRLKWPFCITNAFSLFSVSIWPIWGICHVICYCHTTYTCNLCGKPRVVS